MATLKPDEIGRRWQEVRARVDAAARFAGREPDEVTLVSVSKRHPGWAIEAAYEAGARDFGENYAQEFATKADEVHAPEARWHFIGHLQRNKARLVVGRAALIETVDSARLVRAIARQVSNQRARQQAILIQVRVGDEESKSGTPSAELPALVDVVLEEPGIDLAGLMAIPPLEEDAERARAHFRQLRELRDREASRTGTPLPVLSMGMSADFELAIAEGATAVRVGTAIFGTRTG